MSEDTKQLEVLSGPPFRSAPESTRRVMRTCLGIMLLPTAAGTVLFGGRALWLVVAAGLTGLMTEVIVNAIRRNKQPGSTTHSIMMGFILAFTLPVQSPYLAAVVGTAVAVIIGKHLWGGLGRYIWHPALVGRALVELLWHGAVRSDDPSGLLRRFEGLTFAEGTAQLDSYLAEYLPDLENCLLGATQGCLGATSAVALVLAGLYLMYRGYLHWQLPVMFIVAFYGAALVLPLSVCDQAAGQDVLCLSMTAQGPGVAFTYANYHLLTGTLLLGAFVLTADTTSRPLTKRGKIAFGGLAGFLSIVLRLYTAVPLPACAAVLVMNTFVALTDRIGRRRSGTRSGKKTGKYEARH